VTWSDSYVVDARGGGCNCPDKEYNIHESDASKCKHEQAAMLYDSDMVQSLTVDDDLSTPSVDSSADKQVATDGGNERPVDCDCMDSYKLDDPLPCFPCVRDGFDTPNPDPPSDEDAPTEADADPVAVADGGEQTGVDIVHESGDSHTDWRLQVRDGELEAAKQIPYDGTLRYTTEQREHVSHRKNSTYNADVSDVVDFYESETGADITTCKMCAWPVGSRPNSGTSFRDSRFCSAQCDVKHEHIKADARDDRREEPTRHEPADMGGGETTGVQDL